MDNLSMSLIPFSLLKLFHASSFRENRNELDPSNRKPARKSAAMLFPTQSAAGIFDERHQRHLSHCLRKHLDHWTTGDQNKHKVVPESILEQAME
jgi:hypothetical protein